VVASHRSERKKNWNGSERFQILRSEFYPKQEGDPIIISVQVDRYLTHHDIFELISVKLDHVTSSAIQIKRHHHHCCRHRTIKSSFAAPHVKGS
jgi:hypothetical protein